MGAVPQEKQAPLRLGQAQAFIARSYVPTVGIEEVELSAAAGRILARDLMASTDLPRFDAAAVDGYAVRAEDLAEGATVMLRLVGRSAAGHASEHRLGSGEAIRIFTGAPVPAGADLVLMQEDCRPAGERVVVSRRPAGRDIRGRDNIRRQGEDITRDSLAIGAGTRLGPAHLALAGALHNRTLPVYRRLKVALFSTGDELCAPTEEVGPWQIADANRPMLLSFLAGLGCCAVDDRGILKDRPEEQIAAMIDAAQANDLIISSGGASVGEEDHLTQVIRRRGHLEVWRLKTKPGKPVGIGDIDDCPILALPGNPVAAAVMFLMLGIPLIAQLAGCAGLRPRVLRLPAGRDIAKRPGRWEALAARLVPEADGRTCALPQAKTGSAMLSSLAGADGFITLPEDVAQVRRGEMVEVVLLPGS